MKVMILGPAPGSVISMKQVSRGKVLVDKTLSAWISMFFLSLHLYQLPEIRVGKWSYLTLTPTRIALGSLIIHPSSIQQVFSLAHYFPCFSQSPDSAERRAELPGGRERFPGESSGSLTSAGSLKAWTFLRVAKSRGEAETTKRSPRTTQGRKVHLNFMGRYIPGFLTHMLYIKKKNISGSGKKQIPQSTENQGNS